MDFRELPPHTIDLMPVTNPQQKKKTLKENRHNGHELNSFTILRDEHVPRPAHSRRAAAGRRRSTDVALAQAGATHAARALYAFHGIPYATAPTGRDKFKRSVSGVRKLRERSLGAETVCGLGTQTAGSPECVAWMDARGLTAAARLTVHGTPHTHTRAESDTTDRGSKEH
ncbi:hypothetical protein EVAR_103318_1 [Eumeta japonica]|uniref:Uncharacterized protein n=1 Tax=Eumeta variegata TaxID=151549 RepID=A0A4C1SMN2_EUMVA|nr:hypothetical protein EVAR_103318_1 [Eumeta japonica]